MSTTIVKNIKRMMAAEYSRNLSTKVFLERHRLVRLGIRTGGNAGYGLRRVLHGAPRNVRITFDIDLQIDRIGKPSFQMPGEAIARNHVEAHARAKHHARLARLRVSCSKRLKNPDLARDIDAMNTDACVGHRARGGGKRTCGSATALTFSQLRPARIGFNPCSRATLAAIFPV
jgi:hypothetical protein